MVEGNDKHRDLFSCALLAEYIKEEAQQVTATSSNMHILPRCFECGSEIVVNIQPILSNTSARSVFPRGGCSGLGIKEENALGEAKGNRPRQYKNYFPYLIVQTNNVTQ